MAYPAGPGDCAPPPEWYGYESPVDEDDSPGVLVTTHDGRTEPMSLDAFLFEGDREFDAGDFARVTTLLHTGALIKWYGGTVQLLTAAPDFSYGPGSGGPGYEFNKTTRAA